MKVLVVMDNLRSTDLDEASLWLSDLLVRWAVRGYRVEVLSMHGSETGCAPEDDPDVPLCTYLGGPAPRKVR